MRNDTIRRIVKRVICVVMLVIALFVGVILHDCLFDNDLIVEETTCTVDVVSWRIVDGSGNVVAASNQE